MLQAAAYVTSAVAIVLVLARPRVAGGRLRPAWTAFGAAAVLVALGAVGLDGLARAAGDLWRPFLTVAAIMVMTHVATELGVLELWARRASRWAHTTRRAFAATFLLGVVTSTALNNDAAILLLVPLVLAMVRRRYANDGARMAVPFSFAVFVAAGVAPFPVANPMNLVVADYAGLGFNDYAAAMLPIAVAVWIVSFALLAWWFRADLAVPIGEPTAPPLAFTLPRLAVMAILLSVLAAYAVVSWWGGPPWAVALAGAALAVAVARGAGRPGLAIVVEGVSWRTLVFLSGVVVIALALEKQGFVAHLAALYGRLSATAVGLLAAVGSALLNNHPMAYLNMLALTDAGRGEAYFLAALVGGDLGPRLLPIGSLAGLLWLERLQREGIEVPLSTFVRLGAFVTIPSLAVALGLLALLT